MYLMYFVHFVQIVYHLLRYFRTIVHVRKWLNWVYKSDANRFPSSFPFFSTETCFSSLDVFVIVSVP